MLLCVSQSGTQPLLTGLKYLRVAYFFYSRGSSDKNVPQGNLLIVQSISDGTNLKVFFPASTMKETQFTLVVHVTGSRNICHIWLSKTCKWTKCLLWFLILTVKLPFNAYNSERPPAVFECMASVNSPLTTLGDSTHTHRPRAHTNTHAQVLWITNICPLKLLNRRQHTLLHLKNITHLFWLFCSAAHWCHCCKI